MAPVPSLINVEWGIRGWIGMPIINYPEVAILGVHKITKRPVVHENQIVIRDMTYLSLSFDHRVLTALEQNPYVGRQDLRFETEDGRVILRGRVSSYFHKQMAQEAIRRVDGVEEISNELEVAAT